MLYTLVFYSNKPNAWLEASHTQGLCVFFVGSNRDLEESRNYDSRIISPVIKDLK